MLFDIHTDYITLRQIVFLLPLSWLWSNRGLSASASYSFVVVSLNWFQWINTQKNEQLGSEAGETGFADGEEGGIVPPDALAEGLGQWM